MGRQARLAVGDGSPTPRPRSYPIGLYFAVFGLALAAATGAGVWYARAGAEQQAMADARKDARFGAIEAADEIAATFSGLEEQLAATAAAPVVAEVLATPGDCTLTFTGAGPFGSGHLDFLAPDGTVACTSLVTSDAAPPASSASSSLGHVGADWLSEASGGPILAGPTLDPETGKLVVISVVPVPDGVGFVAAFLDLDSLGTGLADRFAGRLALEFVVTNADGDQILTRSLDAEKWVGVSTDSTLFDVTVADATRTDLDGIARIYDDATVADVGWHVFAGAAHIDALEGATSAFRRALVVIAGALMLMLVIAILIYRRIAGPIKALSLRYARRQPIAHEELSQ